MAHIGHAMLGDSLYAPEDVCQQSPLLRLHAAQLEIEHPVTRHRIVISAKCPFIPELKTSTANDVTETKQVVME